MALASALSGDTLMLADGTYTSSSGVGTHAFHIDSKSLTLRALNPGRAVLDGQGTRGVLFVGIGQDASQFVVLDGLTITGGATRADGAGLWIGIGAVHARGCTFTSNAALDRSSTSQQISQGGYDGGAVFISSSATLFAETTRSEANTASSRGGAVYVSSGARLRMEACTLQGNQAGVGYRSSCAQYEWVRARLLPAK